MTTVTPISRVYYGWTTCNRCSHSGLHAARAKEDLTKLECPRCKECDSSFEQCTEAVWDALTSLPPPGSAGAVLRGCLCPVIDNHYGKGRTGDGNAHGWIVATQCNLHRARAPGESLAALVARLSP
jgi:hypothetical protein